MAAMIFQQIRANGDRNFAYLIGDEPSRAAVVVDPSYAPEAVLDEAERLGLAIKFVISTHSHKDHVAGNDAVVARTKAPVVMHESTPHPCDLRVRDEQALAVGSLQMKFLHTPGHIPDHLCVLVETKLMTGDILFVGKIGGTGPHFPGSDPRQQWDSLQRLMRLPAATEVWPGHDYGLKSSSTIGEEISGNPFLLCKTFEEFLDLKEHWADYKKAHGIV
jgi:hydroxyacylglutathione hydrolase